MRLDKFLAQMGYGSRKDVKKLITNGTIAVNGVLAKKPNKHIDEFNDQVTYLDEPIIYQKYYYVMLNKPAGIVSATEDRYYETVIDWIALDYDHVDLFPVGRLDIDTTGLLLLTNNGQLAHQLLSPRKQVPKIYNAWVTGRVDENDQARFASGLDLGDFTSAPAKLTVLDYDPHTDQTFVSVEIHEGKFHQVKRMFEAVDKQVLTLDRRSMGPLQLDDQLAEGEYRELTEDEMRLLEPYGLINE